MKSKAETYIKVCSGKTAFNNELFVYQSAYPYKAELIEVQKPHTLVLSKIEGIPYLDIKPLLGSIIQKLAFVISKFHSLLHLDDKVLCHWDNQPRNILWDEQRQSLYLVDFEDIRLAYPEADITHLFLFWAEVMDNETFRELSDTFIKAYQKKHRLNTERWKTETRKSRNRFDSRRCKYDKKEQVANPDRYANRRYLSGMISDTLK
ncbi:MAG: phosphotransferase [Candidatus Cloacimonetes bacterium]|nr:phosphotransferase [Candidatus Cloacimonadota bacterium]